MVLGRPLPFLPGCWFVTVSATAESQDKAKVAVDDGLTASGEKTELAADAKAIASPTSKSDKATSERSSTETTPTATQRSPGIRRDPAGKKGIGPYWEAIRHGDEAALARDFAKAEAAYQEAIGLEPKNPMGHFR